MPELTARPHVVPALSALEVESSRDAPDPAPALYQAVFAQGDYRIRPQLRTAIGDDVRRNALIAAENVPGL